MSANDSGEIKVVRIALSNPTEGMIGCVGLDEEGNLVIVQAPSIAQAPFFEVHEDGPQVRLSIPGQDLWVSRSGVSLVVRRGAPASDQNTRFSFVPQSNNLSTTRLANEWLHWAGQDVGARLTLTENLSGATRYLVDFAQLRTSGPVRRAKIGISFWNDRGHSTLVDRAISFAKNRKRRSTADFLNQNGVVGKIMEGLRDADYKGQYAASLWHIEVNTNVNHFYAPDDPYPLLFHPYFRSGLEECLKYSEECRQQLQKGDEREAGYRAGLALHFMTDLTQPMHAANFGNYLSRIWGLWGGAYKDHRHTEFEEAADLAFAALGTVREYDINLDHQPDSLERRVHACAVGSKFRFNTALRHMLNPHAPRPVWDADWMRYFVSGMASDAIRLTEEFLHILISKPETPVYAPPLYIHSAADDDMVLDVNDWGTKLIIHHRKDRDASNQQWVVLDAMSASTFYLCPMFKKTWAVGGKKDHPLKIVDRAYENPSVLELKIRTAQGAQTIGTGDYVLDVENEKMSDRTPVLLYKSFTPPRSNQKWVFKDADRNVVRL